MTPAEEKDPETSRSAVGWTPEEIRRAYEEHARDLRMFLVGVVRNRHLADDLLQGVFARLLERSHQVRRETLRGWLFQVAWNEVQLYRRREGVRVRYERAEQPPVDEPAPLEQLVDRESVERLQTGIAELPEEQRKILEARMREGKKLAVIAGELGLPLSTVADRLQAALKRLKENLH
ncbi:MAG: sigma-70 family RNA polymerase sigma factor [Planctomycetaceae bacterium]|nr:sigma-70 family RNA polymerase sigma factor [Planctomycetaceae bacterium]